MKKIRKSVSFKIFTISLVAFFVFGLSVSITGYNIIKNDSIDSMKSEVQSLTELLSTTVNVEQIQSVLKNGNPSNKDIELLRKEFDLKIAMNENIGNIFMVGLNEKGKYYIPAMSSSMYDYGYKIGGEYSEVEWDKAVAATIKTKKSHSTPPFDDGVDVWLAGFAPIVDENNKVVAIYGVDFKPNEAVERAASESMKFIYLTMLFLFLSCLSVYIFVNKTMKPLNKITEISKKIARGDLRSDQLDIRTNDEIGDLSYTINLMNDNLKKIIKSISLNSDGILQSSENLSLITMQTKEANNQINVSMQEISAGSMAQVESAKKSSMIMEDLTVSIHQVANTSNLVEESYKNAVDQANQGNLIIEKSMEQMNMILDSVHESSEVIKVLEDHSKEISKMVDVIAQITQQTNLLALNASIEAARAGEQGKGFAVVADEVKKLAEQSNASLGQINSLIEKIQVDTNTAVEKMENGVKVSEEGTVIIQKAGHLFEQISNAMKKVDSEIKDVNALSAQMTNNSKEISTSMFDFISIAEQSSANTNRVAISSEEQTTSIEEVASNSVKLSNVSKELTEIVSNFKIK